jgi:HlyD family secretion protein
MRTARVIRGTLTASVTASGALQPYAQVEVRSRATGTVMDVRVQEGDRVTKDQLLAIIDDSDARAGYETGLAQLAAAQAGLAQATLQLRSTRAQNVAAVTQAEDALRTSQARLAQVLAGSRPQEIDQAQAALQQAQSAAELARVKLERTGTLYHGTQRLGEVDLHEHPGVSGSPDVGNLPR